MHKSQKGQSFVCSRSAASGWARRTCISNVCFNGGTCWVEDGPPGSSPTFQCECGPGFGGTLCEEARPCALDCGPGGRCRLEAAGPRCDCPPGRSGPRCQAEADCQLQGCPPGQVCLLELASGQFSCQPDLCKDAPCANNATCRPLKVSTAQHPARTHISSQA